ncbi:MAG: vitamin B12 dependent-methionine synthase activation domain-containing protein [Desulfobacterales bacterium]|nr:vitamin B12 dependent-methionine synthase activation domain-containing protein [Desulfobacterales bacterium]
MSGRIHQDLEEYMLSFESLRLNGLDVANAMGQYEKGAPAPFPDLINKALADVAARMDIRGGYRCFYTIDLAPDGSTLEMENVTFSTGRIIGRQIQRSESIAVFACTIGSGISDLSKSAMENGDMIQGYILDTIGSVAVEKAMDVIQQKLAETERRSGRKITNRFSPGYCDWDISAQRQLFSLLPGNFCGIKLTESALMLPIKSVSGIIGIGKKVKLRDYPCKICESRNCFRRRGDKYWKPSQK